MSSAPVWLITGASAGLGKLLARRALDEGHRVIGAVRNPSAEALTELKQMGMEVVELDVTHSQEDISSKVQAAVSIFGHIDILVNNAGYAALGPLERYAETEIIKQVRTNTLGPLFVTQAVLPSMRSRRSGMVVNVSSFVGMRGDPSNGIYALSKFGLEGWSESLAAEVEDFGISCLIPEFGAFRTAFLEHDTFHRPAKDMLPGYEGSVAEQHYAGILQASFKQPGDPVKGVAHLFKVIVDGGSLNGKKVLRLPIGSDAIDVVTDKVNRVASDLALSKELEGANTTAL